MLKRKSCLSLVLPAPSPVNTVVIVDDSLASFEITCLIQYTIMLDEQLELSIRRREEQKKHTAGSL